MQKSPGIEEWLVNVGPRLMAPSYDGYVGDVKENSSV